MLCSKPGDIINRLESASQQERCLLYVTATRAREELLVTVRG